MHRFAKRLKSLFQRERLDRELDVEVRSHLDLLAEENMRRGMSAEEARGAAKKEFGGIEQTKERYRQQRGLPVFETLSQDIRYGLRMLMKTPALSVVIILILAIGIGSGTSLYSLIDACLLRSNTYPVVERWDVVRAYLPPSKSFVNYLSAPEIREIQQLHELFEDVGAAHGDGFNLTHTEDPERIGGTYISANMIPMTGVAPILGRTFREDEDRPGGPPVAVMSFELWKRKFGGDPNVVGQTIRLNDVEHTIIGVMPAHYGLWGGQVWVPLRLDVADQNRTNRRNWAVCILRKGVTEAQANARLQVLSKQLEQKYGPSMPEYRDWNLSIWNINELVLGGIKPAFLVLAGAVVLLLLIACTNVAILLLARATSRMREVAIRMALGANRVRILRQLLTESLLLSLVGGILGVCVSVACLPLLVHLIPSVYLPIDPELITVNRATLAVAFGLAIVVGILFGVGPAWHVSRRESSESLKEGSAKIAGDRHGRSARNTLVVAEIALSLVVLAGASLMAESYRRLQGLDIGFRPDHLLRFQVLLADTKYPQSTQIAGFFDRAVQSIGSLPGVEGAAAASGSPMLDRTADLIRRDFSIEGRAAEDASGPLMADFRIVTPDYFRTMGIRVLRGRGFSTLDAAGAPRAVVINSTMARLYWPAGNPVGQRIRLGQQYGRREAFAGVDTGDTPLTVVGIVSDAKQTRVIQEPVHPELFLPLDQQTNAPRIMTVMVRSALPQDSLMAAIRGAIRSVDSEQPIFNEGKMEEIVADSFGPKRLTLFLLLFLAAVSLALASVGLYAIIAYSVRQRRHEIAVRMALGAAPVNIRRLVISQGIRLAVVGVALGIAGALVATRWMSSELYGVSATNPLLFSLAALLLVCVALLASYIPAVRAMKVDPMEALRHE